MNDLVQQLVALAPGVTVVGRLDAGGDIGAAARRMRADIVILAESAPDDRDRLASMMLQRPRMKVVAIEADGASGALYELWPRRMRIGEMSAQALSEVIARPPPAEART